MERQCHRLGCGKAFTLHAGRDLNRYCSQACKYATRVIDPAMRFWEKVDQHGAIPEHRPELGPGWLWVAGTDGRGYGFFNAGSTRAERRPMKAHRFAYTACVGPIPGGLVLDHLCRVKACVRPGHLEPVTQGINVQRSASLNLTCKYGHDEWRYTARGRRICQACQRIHRQRYKIRRSERGRAA